MTAPKVSVILTSYNNAKFLDESIQSVLAQTYRDFELIILDDASTDNSWAIINQYNDSRIRAFRNKTQRYHSPEFIPEIAKGEYIAMHHSDDVWEPEKLAKQAGFLDQHPEIGAVFSWVNIIDDNGNINNDVFLHALFRQGNKTRHEWLRQFFISDNALCHPSILIRKQCYTDCGLYNMALWQVPDFDMWIRLCFKYEIHVLPEYLVKYRWKSGGNNTSAINRQTFNRSYFELYMILRNYCRISDIEEFLKIFPSSGKYCVHPDSDLEFALAMTAIEVESSPRHRLFGLQLLHGLMSSPERAEKIRAIHNFDLFDFADLKGQAEIFSLSSPIPAHRTQLEQGIEAFGREDFATAIECLLKAMTEEPKNPLPYAYLAFVCVRRGLVEKAREFIAETIRLAPERADLIAAFGELLLKTGKHYEAAEFLQAAINIQPDLFSAYPALAQSLHLTGKSGEAIALLKTVVNIPSNVQGSIQNTLLQILAECDNLPESEKNALCPACEFIEKLVRVINENSTNQFRDTSLVPTFRADEFPAEKISPAPQYTIRQILESSPRLTHLPDLIKTSEFYNKLANEESKKLLILLCAYRLLGKTKIKLPLSCDKEVWEKYHDSQKDATPAEDGRIMPVLNLPFSFYDLRKYGYNLKVYSYGIMDTYLLRQYAYKDICRVMPGDVVIDGGACYGDTALYFADKAGSDGKVYSFEFIEDNIEVFNKNMALNPHIKNVELVRHPLGKDSSGILYGIAYGPASRLTDKPVPDATKYTTISIDDFVTMRGIEKIDFIKMDIEGSEFDALTGAQKTIEKFRPKLAICIYHKPDDFITIQNLILKINPDYELYIDHFSTCEWETVLFAVDRSKK